MRPLPVAALPRQHLGPTDRANVTIYRPFFTAGVISVLTAGCLLGAIALLGIALRGSYTASTWTPYVLAHANSQLYGWVGFFIMGFALQQHAPTVQRAHLFHRLAYASLILMGIGIAVRFVAEPMVHVSHDPWTSVGVGSCILQTVAVLLFCANTTFTRHRTGQGLTWQTKFVFASLGYLLLIACAEPWVFAQSHQRDSMSSIAFVAEWFPVIRELQFLGFVAMMIFGVALVKLHSCFGIRPAHRILGELGFVLWNVGLWVRVLGWLHNFRSGLQEETWFFFGGSMLGMSAAFLIGSTRVFESVESHLPTHKFIRAGFLWLFVSGLLMVLEPLHLRTIGAPFSHAYTGAIRHAVTVGFISQMIIGVGSHVVARLNGLNESVQKKLWPTFWLINVGNAARVFLEIATDYRHEAFFPMGFTGFVELCGLLLWGSYMLSVMFGRFFRRIAYAC